MDGVRILNQEQLLEAAKKLNLSAPSFKEDCQRILDSIKAMDNANGLATLRKLVKKITKWGAPDSVIQLIEEICTDPHIIMLTEQAERGNKQMLLQKTETLAEELRKGLAADPSDPHTNTAEDPFTKEVLRAQEEAGK